ncbi:MAG: flagellar biosynthetic protein FliR [Nitrospinales bacterium]
MGLFEFSEAEFELFLFVFFRTGALILFAPILGSTSIPARLKIGLVLVLSFAIVPLVNPQSMPKPNGMFELSIYLMSEMVVGIIIGYAGRLLFTSVQLAGTIVDFQMGFGVVNVIDPQTNSQVSISAQLQNVLAVLLFLALNAHHFFIQAIVESFSLINLSAFHFSSFTMEYLLQLFSATFVLGVKIAAPGMAVLFFTSVGLGLVARTVPQMNVFIVGFPLQIGLGLLIVGLAMPFFGIMVKKQILALPMEFVNLMRTM